MNARLVATITCAAALLGAAPALARTTELGKSSDNPTPSCPGRGAANPCQVISRTTGYQDLAGNRRNGFVAPRTGRITAFTLTLAKPSRTEIAFFDKNLGGPAAVRLSILRPVKKKGSKRIQYRLNSSTNTFKAEPFFGRTVQFPLYTTLLVHKGYVVALTVPTWLPALAIGLDSRNAWRASRVKPCSDPTRTLEQTPQTQPGSLRQYFCHYRTARLLYTATLVSTP